MGEVDKGAATAVESCGGCGSVEVWRSSRSENEAEEGEQGEEGDAGGLERGDTAGREEGEGREEPEPAKGTALVGEGGTVFEWEEEEWGSRGRTRD